MRAILLICYFLITVVYAHFFVDSSGVQTLDPIQAQAVRLPNTTEVADASGILNIIEELRSLRAEVQNLQQDLAAMNTTLQTVEAEAVAHTSGCNWQGVYCDCYLENTQDHAAILLGSFCNNTTLEWVRVIDMHITAEIFVCEAAVNTTLCDGVF